MESHHMMASRQCKKTFSRWCNQWLEPRGMQLVSPDRLEEDFSDWTKLACVVEAVTGRQSLLSSLHPNPTLPVENLENCRKVLSFLKEVAPRWPRSIVDIEASDICELKLDLILDFLWSLILCYQIEQDEQSEAAKATNETKSTLLLWCQSALSPLGLHPKDFNESWMDGICFGGLVNVLKPEACLCLDHPESKKENLEVAFLKANQLLSIPQLLDSEDFILGESDEHSVMTYVSYFRHYWMTENQVQNEKKDDKSSLAQIASTKGNNDGHILKLIEKRFLKLKKIKEDKRILEAKLQDMEEQLKSAWTEQRFREHERKILNDLHAVEQDLEQHSAQLLSLEALMNTKEKEYKRLQEEKKSIDTKFNDYKRSAGEKLSKIRSDYDMQERRHQRQLLEEQNKVIEIKVKWEVVEQALSGEKKKRLAAEKRARQLERKLAQVVMNVTHSNLWSLTGSSVSLKMLDGASDEDSFPEDTGEELNEDGDTPVSSNHEKWEKLLGIHAFGEGREPGTPGVANGKKK